MARPPKYPAGKVVDILREAQEKGVWRTCKKYKVSMQTYYRWRDRYKGIPKEQAGTLRELLLENGKLQRSKAKTKKEIKALEDALGRFS